MVNEKIRKTYLSNLFNFQKLSNIFVKSQPALEGPVKQAIKEYKYEWSEIPYFNDLGLDLDTLREIQEYDYLKDIEFIEYDKLISSGVTHTEIMEEFFTAALNEGQSLIDLLPSVPDKELSRRPLVAIDTETTGLDIQFYKQGGRTVHTCYVTGLCLAYSDQEGVEHTLYLPTMNTESDGIPNVPYREAMKFVQRLVDNFSVIYHNSGYDREVCSLNGVKINKIGGFFDTGIIIKQTDWMLQEHPKLDLKTLSEVLLERPYFTMSEMNAKEVGYHNLAYKHVAVYGALDASSTLALFKYFVETEPDLFKTLRLHTLDAQAIDATSVFNRRGYPADYDYMSGAYRDTLRRELILFERFAEIMEELGCSDEIYITKLEAISRELINIYIDNFTEFVKKKTNITLDILNDETALQKFLLAVEDDLGIIIKKKTLKSGVSKLTHSMDVNHLKYMQKTIETIRWMNPTVAEQIVDLVTILLDVSSILQNSNSYYSPFIKSLVFDDQGFYRLPVALRFSGTITTRYSNKSGKPTIMNIVQLKTKTKYSLSVHSGLCGVNAQGIPSAPYMKIKAKKILNPSKLSNSLTKEFNTLEAEVDELYYSKLL